MTAAIGRECVPGYEHEKPNYSCSEPPLDQIVIFPPPVSFASLGIMQTSRRSS